MMTYGENPHTNSAEHICRDEGYSPYVKGCPVCIKQMAWNSWDLHRKSLRQKTNGNAILAVESADGGVVRVRKMVG